MSEAIATKDEPTKVTALPTIVRHQQMATDIFSDATSFEHAQRVAAVFAASSLVPTHFRNNKADCLLVYQIARRLGEEPLTVFQNVYIVSGRPGWMTAYVIARANMAGVFKGRITWEKKGEGDSLAVTATTALAESGEIITVTCDMRMAKAEGWTKNAKYQSMPEHMLRWRSAAMLIRLYAPEVMLGMQTVEELETVREIKDVTPPVSEKMRKSLDDFANGTKAEASEQEEASTQDPSTLPASGQGAPDTQTPQQPESGAPEAQAEKVPDEKAAIAESKAKAKPPAAAGPKTEAEYIAHANAWLDGGEDADLLEQQWTSEKSMRNKANVTAGVRQDLVKKVEEKAAKLRGQA